MTPVKLRLISKDGLSAKVGALDPTDIYFVVGTIEVGCHDAQAFAEIVTRLLESDLAVAAVQNAIHCLQMAKSPADRVADMRRLQDIHFKMTGWHFDSAATPAPIEGVKPSSGSVSMEEARKMFGELDPDKIAGMFPGMPGSKILVVGIDKASGPDYSVEQIVEFGPDGERKVISEQRLDQHAPYEIKEMPIMPGTKIRVVADENVPPGEIVEDFHPKALKE